MLAMWSFCIPLDLHHFYDVILYTNIPHTHTRILFNRLNYMKQPILRNLDLQKWKFHVLQSNYKLSEGRLPQYKVLGEVAGAQFYTDSRSKVLKVRSVDPFGSLRSF